MTRPNTITATDLPDHALSQFYRERGDYADCLTAHVAVEVSPARWIEAFYTSPLFKVERFILKWVVNKPSTDAEAHALARGEQERFAAWSVEGRTEIQLLNCDYQRRTRTWLMAEPRDGGTDLWFGTVVVRVPSRVSGAPTFGPVFHALLWFHKLYARALMRSAIRRLQSSP